MKYLIIIFSILVSSISMQAQNCATTGDRDNDGLCDDVDPCPDKFNPNPVDADGDNVYDACDNSPVYNPDQADIDGDGIGDVSDPCIDPDGDGVCGSDDKCEGGDDNVDIDFDGIPDACDDCIDEDRDDICDDVDDCISTNAGTACDDGDDCTEDDELDEFCDCAGRFRDADNDGVCDLDDLCPGYDDTQDFDNDGIPDGCDESANCTTCTPDENDKITICHFYIGGNTATLLATCKQLDQYFDNLGDFANAKDHCGPCTCADAGDVDSDGDGICDKQDPCPNDANDSDGDGVCDSMDACPDSDDNQDQDGDGIPDGCDDLQYCTPTYDNTMEWIASIQLNNTTYRNGQSDVLTLHEELTQLEKGSTHELTITPELIDNVCEVSMAVFIDLNGDGDFEDSNEELYTGRSHEAVVLTMSVDNYAVSTYRMRTILHYGRISSSCQTNIDGEVEDLLFEVIGQQPCASIVESFDYNDDQALALLNGGDGWLGEWQVSSTTADQVVVLTGSLDEAESSNRIGILNNGASTIQLKRAVDIDLGGSENLYFSILLERISGEGSMDINLGGVTMGINATGNLYLNNQEGEALLKDVVYELQFKAVINPSGTDVLTLVASTFEGDDISLSRTGELGGTITEITITTVSTNSFLPLAHYVDDIIIGCTEDNNDKKVSSKIRLLKTAKQVSSEPLSIDLWPNPIVDTNSSVMIHGQGDLYKYEIIDPMGRKIIAGSFFQGYNQLPALEGLSGLYYLVVSDGVKVVTTKMVR